MATSHAAAGSVFVKRGVTLLTATREIGSINDEKDDTTHGGDFAKWDISGYGN